MVYDLEWLLANGTISLASDLDGYQRIYEPYAMEGLKSATVLFRRDRIDDLFEALVVYLEDQYRGAMDYPVTFFDPSRRSSDID